MQLQLLIIFLKKFLLMIVILLHCNLLHSEYVTVFKDNEIEDYIKGLSKPLLKSAGIEPKSVTFYLIDNPNPNAFVSGGQNVFVFSGLLNFIQTDDELAGVIAHELSHITEGHLLQGSVLAQKSQAIILVSLLLGTIAVALSPTAYLGAVLTTLTIAPTIYNAQLYYSRADEMQADMLAINILKTTPYSGHGLISFMEKLQTIEGNPNYPMSWYSTHPLTSTRIQYLKSYLKDTIKTESKPSVSLLRVKVKLDAINLDYQTFVNKYTENNEIKLYGLAIAKLKDSNYKTAKEIINLLLQKNPKDIYYLELLGDIYFSLNQFKQAYNTYLKINKSNDYITDLKIAKSAFSINNPLMLKESLKYVNISLGKNSHSPLAWHLKSLILAKLNHTYLATLAVAQKYYTLGEYKLAKHYAQKAIRGIKHTQPEWLEAQDLIEKIKIN